METLKVWQGLQRDYECLQINQQDGTAAINIYTAATTLTASVWLGADQTTIFQPTVTWFTNGSTQTGYGQGQFSISFLAANTLTLDPGGEYHVLVNATTSGVTSAAWEGMVAVRATPGSTTPSPVDLITYDYCLGVLRLLGTLTDTQIDVVPLLIPAASQLWRMMCGNTNFDQRTLVEWHEPSLDGYVRLWQVPVQVVSRVQGVPDEALTIANTSASVQTAQAYFSYTTSISGTETIVKAATGITLSWSSNGTPAAPVTLLFATYPTIGALATAITAVGSGWSATVSNNYSSWASTELTNGFVAQNCSNQGPQPTTGAVFNILGDLNGSFLRPSSPMLWVGRQYGGNLNARRWGPGGYQMFDGDGQNTVGEVRVTYTAGYPVIPPDVQFQVAQLVKWKLELGVQELLLEMEQAADYQYKMNPEMAHMVPQPVRDAAGRWKQHFA